MNWPPPVGAASSGHQDDSEMLKIPQDSQRWGLKPGGAGLVLTVWGISELLIRVGDGYVVEW